MILQGLTLGRSFYHTYFRISKSMYTSKVNYPATFPKAVAFNYVLFHLKAAVSRDCLGNAKRLIEIGSIITYELRAE